MPTHRAWNMWRIDRDVVLQKICSEASLLPPGEGTEGRSMPSLASVATLLLRPEGGNQTEWRKPMPSPHLSQVPHSAAPDYKMQSVGDALDVQSNAGKGECPVAGVCSAQRLQFPQRTKASTLFS